jgi:hypothetical protein
MMLQTYASNSDECCMEPAMYHPGIAGKQGTMHLYLLIHRITESQWYFFGGLISPTR